jgi:Transglycosylase SLT domain
MKSYLGWITDPNGLIVVTRDDGTTFVPALTGPSAEVMEKVIARWADALRVVAARHGMRYECPAAMIYQESGGNPRAFRQEPKRSDEAEGKTGVGLLQITDPGLKRRKLVIVEGLKRYVGGWSDEQLFEPELNLEVGVGHIGSLIKRYGYDFPKLSAAFNAGSVHAPYKGFENPWGMHAWHGHIDSEVCAYNYAVQRGLDAALLPAPLFDLTDLARGADDAARRDTDPAPPEKGEPNA